MPSCSTDNYQSLRSMKSKSWISRQWMPYIIRDETKPIGPGAGCGYLSYPKQLSLFSSKKSCFSINLLLFSSSHFQKSPRTSLFSSKKVLAPSTCLCEKVLARSFFSGTGPCPLLLTATLCSNEFCVVPQGRSVFRRTSLMDGSWSYDQHQLEEPRYGLSI